MTDRVSYPPRVLIDDVTNKIVGMRNQADVPVTFDADMIPAADLTAAQVPALQALVSEAGKVFTFYVDPTSGLGSDDNDGKSTDTPFASIAAAVAAVGSNSGLSIGIRAGMTFREQLSSAAPGLLVDKYGTGALPMLLGSTALTGTWTNVSGNIWSTPLAYTPATAAWVTAAGVIVKLYPGTAGSLAANQFAVSGGNLQVNIGKDPTGDTIEVPRNISNTLATAIGINTSGADQTFKNLRALFWPNSGTNTVSANTKYLGVDASFNAYDGFDQFNGATNFLIDQCVANYNGITINGGGGAGDGSSAHDLAQGTIRRSTFKGNTQTGAGNVADTSVLVERNYFEDNRVDMQVYSGQGGSPGDHTQSTTTFRYNLVRRTVDGLDAFFSVTNNAVPAGIVNIHNNTFWKDPAAAGFAVGFLNGMTVDLANNVFDLGQAHNNVCGCYAGTVTSRNNTARNVSVFFQGGYGPSSTVNDVIGDPEIIDGANGNLGIKATSPAIASGASLGYTEDYRGNPVPSVPNRGALQRL